jgi:hypothetical protein
MTEMKDTSHTLSDLLRRPSRADRAYYIFKMSLAIVK